MDTNSFNTPVEAGEPSRLPAGSTLLVNGIHVPHPHAEVNLPGAGDPRLGDTKAVTETVKIEGEGDNVTATLVSDPLHDEVKPRDLAVKEYAINKVGQ